MFRSTFYYNQNFFPTNVRTRRNVAIFAIFVKFSLDVLIYACARLYQKIIENIGVFARFVLFLSGIANYLITFKSLIFTEMQSP